MVNARISSLLGIILIVIVGFSLWGTELALADGPPVQWQKTFGGSGRSVQQTSDGGYIITGIASSGGYDIYLIKTDPNGNKKWEKTFGGSDADYGLSVQQTTDGGYIIAGRTGPVVIGDQDIYLIKTEPNGAMQWEKTFGGSDSDVGYSVQQTTDGGYIIAGETYSFGVGSNDVYLIKTDPNGDSQWQRTFGGFKHEIGYSVQQTLDGGYIIVGISASSFEVGTWVYLIKTRPDGTMKWQKIFRSNYSDTLGYSVQQTSDNGYIIAGWTVYSDVYLLKTDSSGNKQWEKTYGGSFDDRGDSVQQTTDGGYIIAGYTKSFGAGRTDIYLIKTDPNGNSQWQKTLGGVNSYESGKSVQQTADGGYIVIGNVYLIKLCPEGTLSGDLNCDGTVNYEDVEILVSQWLQPRSILDPHADIYGVGDGIVDFFDFSTQAEDFGKSSSPH